MDQTQEYKDFVEKFKPKKTTDDCYTPENIYNAVAEYVAKQYGLKRESFVRPFWPGGNYKEFRYQEGCTVVDNPPFSIFSEICKYYHDRKIGFFLFGPTLTLFGVSRYCCVLPVGVGITYANGAVVNTSFATNLEPWDLRGRTAPDLYQLIDSAEKSNRKKDKKELPKYEYPDAVLTSAKMYQWSRYGVDYAVSRSESLLISSLDEQDARGKTIFGKGLLLTERASAERQAAERQAAERQAAERQAAERQAAERWELSEREKKLQEDLAAGRIQDGGAEAIHGQTSLF